MWLGRKQTFLGQPWFGAVYYNIYGYNTVFILNSKLFGNSSGLKDLAILFSGGHLASYAMFVQYSLLLFKQKLTILQTI